MSSPRRRFRSNQILAVCASLKITLGCLILLFILTFWGTVDQVYNGLYLAQERFFNSFFFTFWGFIPFPGAHLVLWVLFINLVAAAFVTLDYRRQNIGLIITHFGILFFFVAAFVTFHGTQEGHLTLMEGEGSNVALSYHDWEISAWKEATGERHVSAYDTKGLREGRTLAFPEYGFTLTVDHYYPNSEAYLDKDVPAEKREFVNATGIVSLKQAAVEKEPEKNVPGGIFSIEDAGGKERRLLLYGGEGRATALDEKGQKVFLRLQRRRLPIPFVLRLKDFMMEVYPNTEMAKSYKSLVEIMLPGGGTREVLISMNKPLRYKNITAYQSSYSVDKMGRQSSTLAVVRNSGRILPYIATFVTFAGLAIHLLVMAFQAKLRGKK